MKAPTYQLTMMARAPPRRPMHRQLRQPATSILAPLFWRLFLSVGVVRPRSARIGAQRRRGALPGTFPLLFEHHVNRNARHQPTRSTNLVNGVLLAGAGTAQRAGRHANARRGVRGYWLPDWTGRLACILLCRPPAGHLVCSGSSSSSSFCGCCKDARGPHHAMNGSESPWRAFLSFKTLKSGIG